MVRYIIALTILFSISFPASACDVCVVSGNAFGSSLLANYKLNRVNLTWQTAFSKSLSEYGASATDNFQTLELSINYHVLRRLRISIFQPIRFNKRTQEGITNRANGLGDTRILLSYILLDNKPITSKTKLFVEFSLGAQLPIGKYNNQLHNENMPLNFNAGRDSWAGLFQYNVVLNFKNWGLMNNANLQLNGKTKSNYQFGNLIGTNILGFWQKVIKQSIIIPFSGWYFEHLAKDKYANDNEVSHSGGYGHYAQIGFNVKYNKWLLGTDITQPIKQNYAANEAKSKARFSTRISFIF